MLLRKESEDKIFDHIVAVKIEPILKNEKFKYLRSKNRFERGDKEFIEVISISKGSLTFSDKEEQLYFSLHLQFRIEHKLYEKWFEQEFNKKASLAHQVKSFSVYAPIDLNFLSEEDFYEPSKAVAFKRYISASLSKHRTQPEYVSLDAVLSNLPNYLLEMSDLCDYRKLFAARPYPLQASYVYLLLYYKDIDIATDIFQKNFDKLVEIYNKAVVENSNQISHYVDYLKEYKVIGERFLNIKFQLPTQIGFQSICSDRKLDLSPIGLNYIERFTLDKPFRKIISYAVNPSSGQVIVGHQGQVFTIWSSEGILLLQVDMVYPNGYDELREFKVGYLSDLQSFYANNYIITAELEVHTLDIPLKKEKKDKYQINPRLDVPIAYCKEASCYIMLFSHLSKNFTFFYDTNFNLINEFEIKYRPLDILPNRKLIATFEYMKRIVLYDFSGKTIVELESSNANIGHGDYNYHDISKNENYLFSFFYNVKSTLFSLDDFSKKTLWGHTTFVKDYKELYYNDIHHNFGINHSRISPDEKYIVAGAEHGKYVAWKLPSAERIELIPNEEFLKKLPDALIYEIGNNIYLKNRGNGIRDIQFYGDGNYFTTLINNDILIWDKNFVQLSTIDNVGKIVPFTDKYVLVHNGDALTLFENKK